ncbi:hypothetical protein [Spirosoma sp. KUDC1026]|uniref:hypothetical protein n=1 Tax=Spirosoma sp. KUDC1026 TaxID=2745947 RepID=UPI00159B89C8|nr:hypothetical protein [Spirosoma sp. KUDC1026]QKZ13220.1 hypothetical protein HU175_11480 [Spirosoma sp. KUDC1026]
MSRGKRAKGSLYPSCSCLPCSFARLVSDQRLADRIDHHLLRFMPFVVFLLIPYLLTVLSSHVLNWDRIFQMLPDETAGFGLLALLNLLLVVFPLATYRAIRQNPSPQFSSIRV